MRAQAGVAPLAVIGSDVYCVFYPEADNTVALEAGYRVARVLALATLRDASVPLDVPAVQDALADIVRQVGEVQGMKSRLTSIATPRAPSPSRSTTCAAASCAR